MATDPAGPCGTTHTDGGTGFRPGDDTTQPDEAGKGATGATTRLPAVLHVVTDTTRRGAQLFGLQLHEALRRRGHPSEILALAPGEPEESLEIPVLGPSRLGWRTLRGLRSRLRDADVAVAHGSTTLAAGAMAGVATGTPFVYRSIGDPLFWVSTVAQRLRTGLLLHRAAAVVALWRGAAEELVRMFRLPRPRVAVIPHGVPAERFPPPSGAEHRAARRRLGIEEGQRVLVCLGSLSWEKNVGAAIEATARRPDDVLLIVGDGPLRPDLEARARRRAPGRVRFLGTVEDPAAVLRAADVLIMPSRTEGTPGAAIEAGLMGIPVVATTVGGLPRVVVDGVTGRLVREPSPDLLAEAVGEVLGDGLPPRDEIRDRLLAHDLAAVVGGWRRLLAAVSAGRVPGGLRPAASDDGSGGASETTPAA